MASVFEISAAILASIGGAAVIMLGLSSWLGKVWANRILEQDRLKYASELENLRNQLRLDSQRQELIFSKYFEGQFKLYNDLWVSLVELQSGVDMLWSDASSNNLRRFVTAIRNAKTQIRNSALLIEPAHYHEIMNALTDIGNYQLGKEQLIRARQSFRNIHSAQINEIISKNRENRDRIARFVDVMLEEMRAQIGGNVRRTTAAQTSQRQTNLLNAATDLGR